MIDQIPPKWFTFDFSSATANSGPTDSALVFPQVFLGEVPHYEVWLIDRFTVTTNQGPAKGWQTTDAALYVNSPGPGNLRALISKHGDQGVSCTEAPVFVEGGSTIVVQWSPTPGQTAGIWAAGITGTAYIHYTILRQKS